MLGKQTLLLKLKSKTTGGQCLAGQPTDQQPGNNAVEYTRTQIYILKRVLKGAASDSGERLFIFELNSLTNTHFHLVLLQKLKVYCIRLLGLVV